MGRRAGKHAMWGRFKEQVVPDASQLDLRKLGLVIPFERLPFVGDEYEDMLLCLKRCFPTVHIDHWKEIMSVSGSERAALAQIG